MLAKIFFLINKHFWSEKLLDAINFGQKRFVVKIIFVHKHIGLKKFWIQKNLRSKKFGQNWVLLLRHCCHGQISSGQMSP